MNSRTFYGMSVSVTYCMFLYYIFLWEVYCGDGGCNHRTLEAGILHAPTVLCKQDALPAHRCWQQLHSAARAMTCGGAKSHVCQQRLLPRHPPSPELPLPPASQREAGASGAYAKLATGGGSQPRVLACPDRRGQHAPTPAKPV